MAQPYSVALPPEKVIKPAFIVKKLEGTREQEIISFDAKKGKLVTKVEVDAGYLVKFPHKGHSIRVANEKELARLGFDQTVPLLNGEGDVMGEIENGIMENA